MDSAKLILTEPVRPPTPLGQLETSRLNNVSDEEKKQIAKDFESVLLNKLLDVMNSTIGDWGFEKEGPFRQVQSIFSMYLSQDVANNGGLGLWEDIYQFLTKADSIETAGQSLDGQV